MTKHSLNLNLLLAAALAVATAAAPAARASDGLHASASVAHAKHSKKLAWVRMASKANGSGIRVSFVAPKSLAVSERGAIELLFSGVTEGGSSVRLGVPAGARLVDGSGADVGFVALPAGETTRLSLQFTPVSDGSQTIDLFTEQDGRTSAQSIAVKVGSGAVSLKTNGNTKTAAGGERVISMPAQTSR